MVLEQWELVCVWRTCQQNLLCLSVSKERLICCNLPCVLLIKTQTTHAAWIHDTPDKMGEKNFIANILGKKTTKKRTSTVIIQQQIEIKLHQWLPKKLHQPDVPSASGLTTCFVWLTGVNVAPSVSVQPRAKVSKQAWLLSHPKEQRSRKG